MVGIVSPPALHGARDPKRLSGRRSPGTARATFGFVLSRLLLPLALWVAVTAAAVGCSSPTLPLPPPSLSELRLDNGQVTVEGSATPGALVFVWNRDVGDGRITTAEDDDGYFMAVVPGSAGDTIVVWSQLDDQQSPTIERVVPPSR